MNTNIILDGFNAMLKQLIASAVADAVKPLQDRIVALEINQSMGKAVFTLPDVDFNEAVRNVLDDGDYVKREDIYDAVTTAIDNYDFSDIIQEMLPEELDKDVVQQMIDEALDNLSISRN